MEVMTPLIDDVSKACRRLAKDPAWLALMKAHGLDLSASDLRAELSRPLAIDRRLSGFTDFAREGTRGIEPGRPDHSLLYHAFASPDVVEYCGKPLGDYPTPPEIEAVENYVFGAQPPSIQDLRNRAAGAPLALVVFAVEYRVAANSVHQHHAELCFSRTGLARVGTRDAAYSARDRGYWPTSRNGGAVHGQPNQQGIRVLPCRYAAYVAALCKGERQSFGPMRFKDAQPPAPNQPRDRQLGDGERSFWVPLHKLFDGKECIRGRSIAVSLKAHHLNQKLRRIHLALGAAGYESKWHEPDLSNEPFIFSEGLAEFTRQPHRDGRWLLVPVVSSKLVEEARYQGKLLTYRVPPDAEYFSTSLNVPARASGVRSAPEYVHSRSRVNADGTVTDLNTLPDMVATVEKGGYEAIHYLDRTADGWIDVECPELALDLPRRLPAFSLVCPPDFLPLVKQQDLMQWWAQSAPDDLAATIWPQNPGAPNTLSDQRYPANQSLTRSFLGKKQAIFDLSDDTISAVVSSLGSGSDQATLVMPSTVKRATCLPDGAAGVFAPGWDTSIDRTEETDPSDDGSVILPGQTYLATYGLGSPFPEDAKLCAALSSFWPAAAPDVTRTFEPSRYATATPLTDDVIGQGEALPWDGIRGPQIVAGKKLIRYNALAYGDYVRSALNNGFVIDSIITISAEEYVARTVTMARVYAALGATTTKQKIEWAVFSFKAAPPSDAERMKAEEATRRRLSPSHTYRFQVYRPKERTIGTAEGDFNKIFVAFDEMLTLFADATTVLRGKGTDVWEAIDF